MRSIFFCCRWPCESHKETSMRAHPQKVEQAFMALTELDTPQVNIWGYAKHALCTLGWKLSNTSEIVRRCTALPFWKAFTAVRFLADNDFSWTLFSKWANSSGVNSRGHFLSMRIPLLGWIFMDIFLVNSSGHFLMVITNTVGQPTQGVRGPSPC